MQHCTKCDGLGFLNLDQLPEENPPDGVDEILEWLKINTDTDIQICTCCGDGKWWHGVPGEHYGPDDPPGPMGPYASNGGLCRCH